MRSTEPTFGTTKLEELIAYTEAWLVGRQGNSGIMRPSDTLDRYGSFKYRYPLIWEEPGAAELVQLGCYRIKILTMFSETLTSPKLAETPARKWANLKFKSIGGLTWQQMEEGMDYISIMKQTL